MFLVCHLVLVSILISRVFRELMNTRDDNARKSNTEFQTGNLTTAEFSPNFSISCVQQAMPKRSFDSQASVSVNAGPSEHTDVLKHDSPSDPGLCHPEEIHLPHHYQKDDV
ncbi:hypothetical protein BDN70DRAFT_879065 [Pholiota conissans]|uniref:Uncharacterized protein n=1 Tax=Pholiota conissans TaxID=109636 RepID=A0A9P6CTB9_9AGAR|nr:hypothetical protein BDN70DRAFT_879065 [Pholiota conissans]